MDAKEIQDIVQRDMSQFYKQNFPGKLPDWFLTGFEKAVMENTQSLVLYRSETILSIISKPKEDLNIWEVGVVSNIWLAVPPRYLSSDIKKAMSKKAAMEQLSVEWNIASKKEEERLFKKAQSFAQASRRRIIH